MLQSHNKKCKVMQNWRSKLVDAGRVYTTMPDTCAIKVHCYLNQSIEYICTFKKIQNVEQSLQNRISSNFILMCCPNFLQ